jgi:hypothetical protein
VATSTLSDNVKVVVERTTSRSDSCTVREPDEEKKVDVRQVISELVASDDINDAFLWALDAGDVKIVSWLCGQVGPAGDFFEKRELPQISALALAQQLGQSLHHGGEDVVLNMSWLHELMLVLEPENAEIAAHTAPTLQQLLANVEVLRQDKELLAAHPELRRKAKVLSLLISSLANG